MRGRVEPISPGQFFWMMLVSLVAGGIYLWPQYTVTAAGTDASLSLVLATAVSAGNVWMQCRWAEALNVSSLVDGLRKTWGRAGAAFILATSGALILALDGILLSLYGDLLRTFFYPLTPRAVMVALVAAIVCWIAMRSVSVVARNVQFWTPIAVLGLLVVVLLSLPNVHHLAAIRPEVPIAWQGTVHGTVGAWFLFSNGGVAAGFATTIRWAKRSRTSELVLASVGVQGLLLLALLLLVLATLGPSAVSTLTWPIIYVFDLVVLRAFFVTGTGILLVLVWTVAMVLFLSVHIAHLSQNAEVLVGGSRRFYVALFGAILIAASMFFRSLIEAKMVLFDWVDPIYLGYVVLVVPPTFIVGMRRARRGASQ